MAEETKHTNFDEEQLALSEGPVVDDDHEEMSDDIDEDLSSVTRTAKQIDAENALDYRIPHRLKRRWELIDSDVILSVRHLKQFFFFGSKIRNLKLKAVSNVSFDVSKGECFGIVGESGCGKTTTGRTIIKLYNPTSGSIYYRGYRIGAGARWNQKEIKWVRIKGKEKIKELRAEAAEKLAAMPENDPSVAEKVAEIRAKGDERIQALAAEVAGLTLDVVPSGAEEALRGALAKAKENLAAAKAERDKRFADAKAAFQRAKASKSDDPKKAKAKGEAELLSAEFDALGLLCEKEKELAEGLKAAIEAERLACTGLCLEASKLELEVLDFEFTLRREAAGHERDMTVKAIQKRAVDAAYVLYSTRKELKANYLAERAKADPKSADATKIKQTFLENDGEAVSKFRAEKAQLRYLRIDAIAKQAERIEALKEEQLARTQALKTYELKLAELFEKQAQVMDETTEQICAVDPRFAIQHACDVAVKAEQDHIRETVQIQRRKIRQIRYDNAHTPKKLLNEIQMIFQDPVDSLDPRMTVEDIIQEGLHIQGHHNRAENHKKVVEMLEKVGLVAEHASRYPHEFSGGQRQRIGIARALVMNPKLLICDEPISALDVSIRAQIINLLNDLKDEMGLTIIFIAHDLSVVKYFCNRIAVMYFGKMVELATSDELFRHPLHPYTVSLLSAIPKPNPLTEKERVRILYNPATAHDYSVDKPELREVCPGHIVYCNEAELKQYQEKIAEIDSTSKD